MTILDDYSFPLVASVRDLIIAELRERLEDLKNNPVYASTNYSLKYHITSIHISDDYCQRHYRIYMNNGIFLIEGLASHPGRNSENHWAAQYYLNDPDSFVKAARAIIQHVIDLA